MAQLVVVRVGRLLVHWLLRFNVRRQMPISGLAERCLMPLGRFMGLRQSSVVFAGMLLTIGVPVDMHFLARRLLDVRCHVHMGRWQECVARSIRIALCHLLEGIPGCDGTESALHVRVDDLQAVDVGGVYPAETANQVRMLCHTSCSGRS